MTNETYKTKSGAKRFRPVMTAEEYSHSRNNDYEGFCLGCGVPADGIEPDARKCECEECGEELVYGLEELLLMGILRITEQAA